MLSKLLGNDGAQSSIAQTNSSGTGKGEGRGSKVKSGMRQRETEQRTRMGGQETDRMQEHLPIASAEKSSGDTNKINTKVKVVPHGVMKGKKQARPSFIGALQKQKPSKQNQSVQSQSECAKDQADKDHLDGASAVNTIEERVEVGGQQLASAAYSDATTTKAAAKTETAAPAPAAAPAEVPATASEPRSQSRAPVQGGISPALTRLKQKAKKIIKENVQHALTPYEIRMRVFSPCGTLEESTCVTSCSLIIGSDPRHTEILDASKDHVVLLYSQRGWHLHALSGPCVLSSVTLHRKILAAMRLEVAHRPEQEQERICQVLDTIHRKESSTFFQPGDDGQKVSQQMCCFKLGKSEQTYFIDLIAPGENQLGCED